jgi:hypothetical protein
MIAIDQVLVSDEIVEEQFVCNLSRCKGGCCEDGDAGAPLEKAELAELNKAYSVIESYMTPEGIEEVKRSGRYYYDRSFGWVTPTLNGALCAYGRKDANGLSRRKNKVEKTNQLPSLPNPHQKKPEGSGYRIPKL